MDNSTKKIRIDTAIFLFLLSALLLTIFLPAMSADFVNLNDPEYILYNPLIRSLSINNIIKIFTSIISGQYLPLTILSFAFEYKFFGLSPDVMHTTNVFIHLINTLLVYYFILLLSKNIKVALITTILFGIHPLRVESVAWITERKDLLFGLFYLLALISYMKYIEKGRYLSRYFLSVGIFFLLSLLSKPAAISFPLALLAIDYYVKGRISIIDLAEKISMALMSVGFAIIAFYGIQMPDNTNYPLIYNFTFFERIVMACYSFLLYVYRLFYPINLSCFYPYPQRIDGMLPTNYFFTPVLLISIAAFVMTLKEGKYIKFGLSFFFVTIFMNLPLFDVGHVIMADKFTYIPFIGLFFMLSEVFVRTAAAENKVFSVRRITLYFLLIWVVVALSFLTFKRCEVWSNSKTLWDDAIKNHPGVPMAYHNRAHYFAQMGQWDNAIGDYTQAIYLAPNYYAAYHNRAKMYFLKGKHNLALQGYAYALHIKPDYLEANIDIAAYYLYVKDYAKALIYYERALKIDSSNQAALRGKSIVSQILNIKFNSL